MHDITLSPPKEVRRRRPYRSLYAAMLFQSFEDALGEALPADAPTDRDAAETIPRNYPPAPADQPALVPQA